MQYFFAVAVIYQFLLSLLLLFEDNSRILLRMSADSFNFLHVRYSLYKQAGTCCV